MICMTVRNANDFMLNLCLNAVRTFILIPKYLLALDLRCERRFSIFAWHPITPPSPQNKNMQASCGSLGLAWTVTARNRLMLVVVVVVHSCGR